MGSYASLATLAPSGAGAVPPVAEPDPEPEPSPTRFAGRILAPLRDETGNFDGFVLETARGTERCFETRDPEIAAVIQRAWFEHRFVSVLVEPGRPRRPVAVLLDGAMPDPAC
jgi:hypothetical protein